MRGAAKIDDGNPCLSQSPARVLRELRVYDFAGRYPTLPFLNVRHANAHRSARLQEVHEVGDGQRPVWPLLLSVAPLQGPSVVPGLGLAANPIRIIRSLASLASVAGVPGYKPFPIARYVFCAPCGTDVSINSLGDFKSNPIVHNQLVCRTTRRLQCRGGWLGPSWRPLHPQ